MCAHNCATMADLKSVDYILYGKLKRSRSDVERSLESRPFCNLLSTVVGWKNLVCERFLSYLLSILRPRWLLNCDKIEKRRDTSMKKFQIFLFIETSFYWRELWFLLVSEHFSRFLLILFLFYAPLLYRERGQQRFPPCSDYSFSFSSSCSILCDFSYLYWLDYLLSLFFMPMMNQERGDGLGLWRGERLKMNAILGFGISIVSLVTRPASLTISTTLSPHGQGTCHSFGRVI